LGAGVFDFKMQNQRPRNEARPQPAGLQWPALLAIAICAAGAGVTGTLMWARNASPSKSAYVPVAPEKAGSTGEVHEPPPMLTQGQAPAQAQLTLGNWYFDHERWNEAASHYKNALAGGLDNANVRTDLGSALRFAGEPKAALEQYQIAQKQDPSHEQSLFNQGGLWAFSLGDKAKGMAAWRAYLQKFPQGQSVAAVRKLMAQVQNEAKTKPKKS
jgi:tetratricopeptide (TPR) repeat protein